METIEKRLIKALNDCPLSNSEIARRCNVARSTVGKWKLNGKIQTDNLSKLCSVIGLSEKEILNGKKNQLRDIQLRVICLIRAVPPEQDNLLMAIEKLLSD